MGYRTPSGSLRTPILAAVVALVAPLLALVAAPATAAGPDGPYLDDDVVTILDRPMLPGHLVITNGRAQLVRHTKYAILSNEYGYNDKTDPDLDFLVEPLPMGESADADHTGPGPLPQDVRYAEVFEVSRTGQDPAVMLATVGKDGDQWRLAVAGPLDEGMPIAFEHDLDPAGGAAEPRGLAVVGVAGADGGYGLHDIVVNQRQVFTSFGSSGVGGYAAPVITDLPAGVTAEHIAHRQLWDNPTDPAARRFKAGVDSRFVALLRGQDPGNPGKDTLVPAVYGADGHSHMLRLTGSPYNYFNALTDVDPDTRAVVGYDYAAPDWCCAGQGGDHHDSLIRDVEMISPVIAIAPTAGGQVATRWWNPPDKIAVPEIDLGGGQPVVRPGKRDVSSGLAPTAGTCGTAAPGEVPSLEVNSSQLAWDITGEEDFSNDFVDVSCAVRHPGGQVGVTTEVWYDRAPIASAGLFLGAAVPAHSTVDVALVRGCAQLNRTHAAFEDDGNARTSSPFTGVVLTGGGEKEPLDCSMGFAGGKVQPNVFAKNPVGSYAGSLTPLTVSLHQAGGSTTARMAARSIPLRLTRVGFPDHEYFDRAVKISGAGSTPGIEVPMGRGSGSGVLIEALPPMTNDVTVRLHDPKPATPDIIESELVELTPQPVALLAAPPTIAGAGQRQVQDPPEFASARYNGIGTGTISSESSAVSLGIKIEDPFLGSASAELTTTWESSVENTDEVNTQVSLGNLYYGSADEDVMVYNATDAWRFTGTVLSSSTGIGEGTEMYVLQPKRTVMTTQSIPEMAREYPELFGTTDEGDGIWKALIDGAITHEVGDPGSYLQFAANGGNPSAADAKRIEDYCGGSLTAARFDSPVQSNPFLPDPPAGLPEILVSETHKVQTGSVNSEGAFFEIDTSKVSSEVKSSSISMEVSAEAGYGVKVTGGYSQTHGWGSSTSTTLGETTGFSSAVGNVPGLIGTDEEYDWNMFMCRKTLTPGMSVYVLNYTTDGYSGSGGLEPFSDIELESPASMATVADTAPTLSWRQDTGTAKRYDWELEAVDPPIAPDHRSGSWPSAAGYATAAESKADRPDVISVASVSGPELALLPGQAYRWRVKAVDFFGNEEESEWFRFQTPAEDGGPPEAAFTHAPTDPVAGEEVTFTDTSDLHGETATYSWDFDDGGTSDVAGPAHTFDRPGRYDVLLTVETPEGSHHFIDRIRVAPAAEDDSYAYVEGTPLVVPADRGVLVNDRPGSDPDLATDIPPADGTWQLDDDGGFAFTPDDGTCADQTLRYSVHTATGVALAHVTLTGSCRPTVSAVAVTPDPVPEDGQVTVTAEAATDPDRTVASATATIDGGDPVDLAAVDGDLGSASESLTGALDLGVADLEGSDQEVCVTVTDSGGVDSAPACVQVERQPGTPPTQPLEPPACTYEPFWDVAVTHPFCPEILWMQIEGLARGFDDGSYRPTQPLTRQAMAAFAARYLVGGGPIEDCTVAPFTDVPVNHEFCGAIALLDREGATDGFPDGTFRPNARVSRQAAAVFLARVLSPDGLPVCTSKPFSDVPVDPKFCPAIAFLAKYQMTNGYADGTFRPLLRLTRQAAAAYQYRVAEVAGP